MGVISSGNAIECIPFFGALPFRRQSLHDRMFRINDLDGSGLKLWRAGVTNELRAEQYINIPWPVIVMITARAMQRHNTAAVFDPLTKSIALFRQEHIAT